MAEQILLEKEAVETLIKTRNLLDEILETLDILADADSVQKLAEAEEDIKKGRLYEF